LGKIGRVWTGTEGEKNMGSTSRTNDYRDRYIKNRQQKTNGKTGVEQVPRPKKKKNPRGQKNQTWKKLKGAVISCDDCTALNLGGKRVGGPERGVNPSEERGLESRVRDKGQSAKLA